MFYIDESHTTVDGSLFINNSAALDGGVFYTYIHASDYSIGRSHFSENMAGDDGGVMLIGRLNCYVSIDETIFDFNSAGDRGGVIAIIASSMFMEINRTNIFNNTAQFGGVISACNSQVTMLNNRLVVTVDPLLPFCMLYEGDIQMYNITALRDVEVFTPTIEPLTSTQRLNYTESLTTTDSFTTTTEPLTSPQLPVTRRQLTTEPLGTIIDQDLDMNSTANNIITTAAANTSRLLISDVDSRTPLTTSTKERGSTIPEGSISTTLNFTSTMNEPTTTTELLGINIEHTTSSDQTITGEVPDKNNDVIVDSNLAISLSASSLALFVALVIIAVLFVLVVVLLCTRKRKVKEPESANIELIRMREATSDTMK